MYLYGYFQLVGNGKLQPAGEDWGRTLDTYRVGSSLGIREGREGLVVALERGELAEKAGYSVMVLVHAVPAGSKSDYPAAKATAFLRGTAKILAQQRAEKSRIEQFGKIREQIVAEFGGQTHVAVGNIMFRSAEWKTFTEFLMDFVPILFERKWFEREVRRHPLLLWRTEGLRYIHRCRAAGQKGKIPANGALGAYLTCAYDIYVVQHNGRLDDDLIRRLKNLEQFQGARHEIFAEATCLRAGFKILMREDNTDRSKRHAEFIAVHEETGQIIAVEAKSRHGSKNDDTQRIRLGRLINDALEKEKCLPLALFVELNLPLERAAKFMNWESEHPRVPPRALLSLLDRSKRDGQDRWNFFVLTNSPSLYDKNDTHARSQSHFVISEIPTIPVHNQAALMALGDAVGLHGNIPQTFPKNQ